MSEMQPEQPDPSDVVLFRPVGQAELELIRESGMRRFPPRLPTQPIFYPVLTEEYAVRIAREWNTKDPASGFAGYVTRFRVRREFIDRYPVRDAAGRQYQEYWIPATDLEQFNDNIVGLIEVTHSFTSPTSP